tara:strand:+ start:900 stop:1157 length:258 start_codon:yes stop_codon:yes gene_type:complete
MSKIWCKIFNHEDHGQIVVQNTTNDNNDPSIGFSFYPNWDRCGQVTTYLVFSEESLCDSSFLKVDEVMAISTADSVMSTLLENDE